MLRRCFWPDLRAADVLDVVAGGEVDLHELAGDLLPEAAIDLLVEAWHAADGWTIDDVALLDELAALLGSHPPVEEAPDTDPGLRVTGDPGQRPGTTVDVEAADYRDFAHVVVDEAQDLTPMQWRAVARRGPYATWTVVGDLAQRSRVTEPATWEAVAGLIGRRRVAIERLTINYRTPAEIVAVAREVLGATGHDPEQLPVSVREGGDVPEVHATTDAPHVVGRLVADTLAREEGTVAVIAPADLVDVLSSALAGQGVRDPDRVQVLDPRTAKGLEFDEVIVVAPERIVTEEDVGAHQLYVAVTRATRRLRFVADPDATFPGRGSCVAGSPVV